MTITGVLKACTVGSVNRVDKMCPWGRTGASQALSLTCQWPRFGKILKCVTKAEAHT